MDVNRLYVGASTTENVEWHRITIDKAISFREHIGHIGNLYLNVNYFILGNAFNITYSKGIVKKARVLIVHQ